MYINTSSKYVFCLAVYWQQIIWVVLIPQKSNIAVHCILENVSSGQFHNSGGLKTVMVL